MKIELRKFLMTIDTLICVHSQDEEHDNLLVDAIESIVYGSLKPNRLVIVYDACWEKTRNLIEERLDGTHPLAIPLFNIEYVPIAKIVKQGLAVAKNFGLKFCTSEWVTYCDADDKWMNSKLEFQSQACINFAADLCFTQSWDIRSDGALVPNCFPIGYATSHAEIIRKIRQENCLCHGSAMIRRSVLEELGGYNTDRKVLGAEDWDLWQRAFNQGYHFYNVPERLYCYRLGTSVAR